MTQEICFTQEQVCELNAAIGKYRATYDNPCGVHFYIDADEEKPYRIADDYCQERFSTYSELLAAAIAWRHMRDITVVDLFTCDAAKIPTTNKLAVTTWWLKADKSNRIGDVHAEGDWRCPFPPVAFHFRWLPTLEETLDSLVPSGEENCGNFSEQEVREFLREYLPTTEDGQRLWGTSPHTPQPPTQSPSALG